MAAKTVLNYLDRDSVVHKMTGTTKLAFFLLFTFASMITYNIWVLLGLFAVSFVAFKLSKIKYREVRFMMIFMLVFLLLNNLFIFLFDPNQGTNLYGTRHVLCHLFWRYDVTAEQLFYMLNISLKYFVALPVAILFISATNPSEFAASLNSIGISYKVGYSVAIALRYIPDIQRDYHSISQAQQARGVELGKNEHFFSRLKNSVNILLPLILTSIHAMPRLDGGRNATGKRLIAHNAPIDLHALGIAHQLRRRIQRGLEPLAPKDGSRKTRGRSLAIGTGNLNAIEIFVGTSQLIEHIDNRLKQRPSIPRDPPRISSQPNSLIKRKQIKRERHRIRPRTLSHNPKSPITEKEAHQKE